MVVPPQSSTCYVKRLRGVFSIRKKTCLLSTLQAFSPEPLRTHRQSSRKIPLNPLLGLVNAHVCVRLGGSASFYLVRQMCRRTRPRHHRHPPPGRQRARCRRRGATGRADYQIHAVRVQQDFRRSERLGTWVGAGGNIDLSSFSVWNSWSAPLFSSRLSTTSTLPWD